MSLTEQFPVSFAAMILCSALSVVLHVVAIRRRRDRVALNCARLGTAAVLQGAALLLTVLAAERAHWTIFLIALVSLQVFSVLWTTGVVIVKAGQSLPVSSFPRS
jgi:hypothetical protein